MFTSSLLSLTTCVVSYYLVVTTGTVVVRFLRIRPEHRILTVGDTGPRNIIQWVNKAWTDHELKLPVFYRETLARLLALERFRNLIETNISAGAALYTDHKPGLFEESLSNKGQLSAWKIAETADLQSIVEHHYRQGSKMLLADPLSRICAPSL